MKIRKTLLGAMLMTLVLFLNLIPTANAAEGDPSRFTMTPDQTAVTHGDLLTVTITANRSFLDAGITIAYDAAKLEPVAEACSTKEGFQISGAGKNLMVNGQTVVRVSSFPGVSKQMVEADETLAVLTFRTLAPGERIPLTMTAAFQYTENRESLEPEKAESLEFTVTSIPVEGITLDSNSLSLEMGMNVTLKATVTPENASDKTVAWTSSDETKVTVEDGVLTGLALTEEPVTIIASAGGFTAECLVNVVAPPDAGYVISMPARISAAVGEIVNVAPVVKNNAGVKVFNAYDMTFAYDPENLSLITEQLENATLTASGGSVNVVGYGSDQSVDTAPFTLTFEILKSGTTTVTATVARVDHSENALIQNASKASFDPDFTNINGTGYPVTLPDDFNGAGMAEPYRTYDFEALNKSYDYNFEGSTMGGEPVEVIDHNNGKYSVQNVTGPLVIQATATPKTFRVDHGPYLDGAETAQYMTDYTAVVLDDDNYIYKLKSITIGGLGYGGYQYDSQTGVYTIPGEDITGDIVFNITREVPPTVVRYKVTFQGSGAGAAAGNETTVPDGATYSFMLKKEAGYRYTVTCKMGDKEEVSLWPNDQGKYTVANVIGNLVITIEKEQEPLRDEVEVYEYIKLDGKTMYLVLVNRTTDDGQVYYYDEEAMYYSWVYEAWCILTPETNLTVADATGRIILRSGSTTAFGSANYDVNMTRLVDVNDAQLVYDLYNGRYEDFSTINMRRFLNADVNADRKVDTTDAAAVAYAIK